MNEIALIDGFLPTINKFEVLKDEDKKFLSEHSAHLSKVFDSVQIWRTDAQKASIISDDYHPTIHGKFHQAITEQKVQTDQAFYLAKDFEMKKLEIEDLLIDLEELTDSKRDEVRRKRIEIELQFKQYELKQIHIAMKYRMSEIKGWQKLEEGLLNDMRNDGMSEEVIWSKNAGEIESMFFKFLNRLHGVKHTTDGSEARNYVALARFGVQQAKNAEMYDQLKVKCNRYQKESLEYLGEA